MRNSYAESKYTWTPHNSNTHTPSNAQFCNRVPDIKMKQEMDFGFVMFIGGWTYFKSREAHEQQMLWQVVCRKSSM